MLALHPGVDGPGARHNGRRLDISDLIETCDGPRTERLLASARAACARRSRPHGGLDRKADCVVDAHHLTAPATASAQTDAEKLADALRAGPTFITKEAHDEPGCFDRVFLQWIKDGLAGRAAHIDRIGIAYMYVGAWVPHAAAPTEAPDKYFHVGPHVMVVSPHQEELQAFTRDASSGMPYINHLPRRTEVFVVIPMRQWEGQAR